jgi:hypothetical protein
MKVVLFEQECNSLYEGQVDDSAVTLGREWGMIPKIHVPDDHSVIPPTIEGANRDSLGDHWVLWGHWVLRVDGQYIDHDIMRTDICERRDLELEES